MGFTGDTKAIYTSLCAHRRAQTHTRTRAPTNGHSASRRTQSFRNFQNKRKVSFRTPSFHRPSRKERSRGVLVVIVNDRRSSWRCCIFDTVEKQMRYFVRHLSGVTQLVGSQANSTFKASRVGHTQAQAMKQYFQIPCNVSQYKATYTKFILPIVTTSRRERIRTKLALVVILCCTYE